MVQVIVYLISNDFMYQSLEHFKLFSRVATLIPDGMVSVDCGSTQTFTCRAPGEPIYHISNTKYLLFDYHSPAISPLLQCKLDVSL